MMPLLGSDANSGSSKIFEMWVEEVRIPVSCPPKAQCLIGYETKTNLLSCRVSDPNFAVSN